LPGGIFSHVTGKVSDLYTSIPAFSIVSGNQKVLKDGWGRFMYADINGSAESYSVGSAGRPKPGEGDVPPDYGLLGDYTVISMDDFYKDIVYSNGAYVYAPKTR
jgi:hypothetical protein